MIDPDILCAPSKLWLKSYHNSDTFKTSFGRVFIHVLEDADEYSASWAVGGGMKHSTM